jgi:hypothetical protein
MQCIVISDDIMINIICIYLVIVIDITFAITQQYIRYIVII